MHEKSILLIEDIALIKGLNCLLKLKPGEFGKLVKN